jgi:hypothetical protein
MKAAHHLKFGLSTAACGCGLWAIFFAGYLLRQFCAHELPSEPLPRGTTLARRHVDLLCPAPGPMVAVVSGQADWGYVAMTTHVALYDSTLTPTGCCQVSLLEDIG